MTLLRVLVATVWGTKNDPGQAHLRALQHQVLSTSFAGRPNVHFFVVWGVAKRREWLTCVRERQLPTSNAQLPRSPANRGQVRLGVGNWEFGS